MSVVYSFLLAWLFYSVGVLGQYCSPQTCNDCLDTQSACIDTVGATAEACTEACYTKPVFDGFVECLLDCILSQRAGSAACFANDCLTTSCPGFGCKEKPEAPDPGPDPQPPSTDPLPDPDPVPIPSTPPPPIKPPPVCNYRYLSQFCTVPETERCLYNRKKLVRGTTPTYNGCGPLADSLGLKAIRVALDTFAGDFQDSCNNHDICYGSCSFGDDSLFNTCNSNFLAQMLAACQANYPTTGGSVGGSIVRAARGAICVAQANFVYTTVQLGGCEAYGNAQSQGCRCVDCDDTPMEANTISIQNPVINAATAFCGIAPDIAADWTNFVIDFGMAIASADPDIAIALRLFGSQIGYTSAQPSSQIQALVQNCRGSSARRSNIRFLSRQTRSRLSNYFASLSLDPRVTYGCPAGDKSVCETANALVAIARIARALDDYGVGTTPATSSNTSSARSISISSSPSSLSIPLSMSWNPTANVSSASSGVTSLGSWTSSSTFPISAANAFSTGTTSTSSSSPGSNTPSSALVTSISSVSSVSTTTSKSALPASSLSSPLGSSNLGTLTASSTNFSVAPSSSGTCKLVQVSGDSPDSPDSPDGQPEVAEIPNYPVSSPAQNTEFIG